MAKQKCKTEKIDINPSRVQNPYAHLKRSPGKFDQKVYMEQELNSNNNVKFYRRLYTTQQRAQLSSYDKYIAEVKKRSSELRAQNQEYTYLSALRTALHREKDRRQSGAQTARPVTPEEVRRRLNIERRMTIADVQPPQEETPATEVKPAEVEPAQEASVPQVALSIHDDSQSEVGSTNFSIPSDDVAKKKGKQKVLRRKCSVSPSRLATLESLSYEIMTNTLPINKMKRILPDETLPVHERWPILSEYRRQTVLPSVKHGKQRLTEDMNNLHTRINQFYKCDNFPLWQYKYVPKDHPTKYKLLKAIETEGIQLPNLPKS